MLFDEKGLLSPASELIMSLSEFEEWFVASFSSSTTRQSLFSNYLKFVRQFSEEVSPTFTHWLDGSFVTAKVDPKDLDLVTFIDDAVYTEKQALIDGVFRLAGAKSVFPGIDAYTVRMYSESNSVGTSIANLDRAYWWNLFTHTRPDRFGKRHRKGFIAIVFDGNSL